MMGLKIGIAAGVFALIIMIAVGSLKNAQDCPSVAAAGIAWCR